MLPFVNVVFIRSTVARSMKNYSYFLVACVYRYSNVSLDASGTAKGENGDEKDEGIAEINDEPTSPTSVYMLSLSPLSSEVLSNISSGQQPESPPGITQVSCCCCCQ